MFVGESIKLRPVKVGILRWMSAFTFSDKMPNEYMHKYMLEKVGVAPVAYKYRESGLIL